MWQEAERLTGLPTGVQPAPRLGFTGAYFSAGRRLDLDNAGRLVFPWRNATRAQPIYASTFAPN